jgi:hypothetical protein
MPFAEVGKEMRSEGALRTPSPREDGERVGVRGRGDWPQAGYNVRRRSSVPRIVSMTPSMFR